MEYFERTKRVTAPISFTKKKSAVDDFIRAEEREAKRARMAAQQYASSSGHVNMEYCVGCKQGGKILMCDLCPNSFHLHCLEPQLKHNPSGTFWTCPTCTSSRLCCISLTPNAEIDCHYCDRRYSLVALLESHFPLPLPKRDSKWRCSLCNLEDGVDKILGHRSGQNQLFDVKLIETVCSTWEQHRSHQNQISKTEEQESKVKKEDSESQSNSENEEAGGDMGNSGAFGEDDMTDDEDIEQTLQESYIRSSLPENTEGISTIPPSKSTKELLEALKVTQRNKQWNAEYLVKWKGRSYWHCSWVPCSFLKAHSSQKLRNFQKNRYDSSPLKAGCYRAATICGMLDPSPSELHEVLESLNREKRHGTALGITDDENIFNGDTAIDSNWLVVDKVLQHRIVSRDGIHEINEYLTKWKNLTYDELTWELEFDLMNSDGDGEDTREDNQGRMAIDDFERRLRIGTSSCFVKKVCSEGDTVDEYKQVLLLPNGQVVVNGEEELWEETTTRDANNTLNLHDTNVLATPSSPAAMVASTSSSPHKKPSTTDMLNKLKKFGKFYELEKQPSDLCGKFELYNYQLAGVNWLRDSWYQRRNVILADEMGLGKTIQTICYVRCIMIETQWRELFENTKKKLRERKNVLVSPGETSSVSKKPMYEKSQTPQVVGRSSDDIIQEIIDKKASELSFRPFLIVAPLSTLGNWEKEFKAWCPYLNVVTLSGNSDARKLIKQYEIFETVKSAYVQKENLKSSKSYKKPKLDIRFAIDIVDSDDDVSIEDGSGDSEILSSTTSKSSWKTKKLTEDIDARNKPISKRAAASDEKLSNKPKFHVLLTSYELVAKEKNLITKINKDCKLNYESIIIDEAHRLKSGVRGQLFQSLKDVSTNHRILLTGTPLQNTLEELFQLLLFLEPEKFVDLESLQQTYSGVHIVGNI